MKEAFTVYKSTTMEEVAAEQSTCDPDKVLNVDLILPHLCWANYYWHPFPWLQMSTEILVFIADGLWEPNVVYINASLIAESIKSSLLPFCHFRNSARRWCLVQHGVTSVTTNHWNVVVYKPFIAFLDACHLNSHCFRKSSWFTGSHLLR